MTAGLLASILLLAIGIAALVLLFPGHMEGPAECGEAAPAGRDGPEPALNSGSTQPSQSRQ